MQRKSNVKTHNSSNSAPAGNPSAKEILHVPEKVGVNASNCSAEEVVTIPIDRIVDFKNHTFNVKDDKAMRMLKASIEADGIKTPVIVRPVSDGNYEMISGHRRKKACIDLNIAQIPAIVRKLSDEEAETEMVVSNFQRPGMTLVEKSDCCKLLHDRRVHAGTRTGGNTLEAIATEFNTSPKTVQRLVDFAGLCPEVKAMVENKTLTFVDAIALKNLSEAEQLEKAKIRAEASNTTKSVSFKAKDLSRFFPDIKGNELKQAVLDTLSEWADKKSK